MEHETNSSSSTENDETHGSTRFFGIIFFVLFAAVWIVRPNLASQVYYGPIAVVGWLLFGLAWGLTYLPPSWQNLEKGRWRFRLAQIGRGSLYILIIGVALITFGGALTKKESTTAVYVTNTGQKYHRGECQYLSESMISTTLGAAQSAGLEPCSVCRPPTN